MKKILNIALNDLRITFGDSSVWVFVVLIPAALVFVVGLGNGALALAAASPSAVIIDVADHDQSDISRQFVANIKAIAPEYVLCPQENTDADVCKLNGVTTLSADDSRARVESRTVNAYVEIPSGFGASVDNGQPLPLVYRSDEDVQFPSAIYSTVSAAVQRLNGALVARYTAARIAAEVLGGDAEFAPHVFQKAAAIWAQNPVQVVRVESIFDSRAVALQAPGFRQSAPGMGSMYVMFTVMAGAGMLLVERKNWTLQRLMAMPVTSGQVIAGKMLGRVVVGMVQYGVAFGVGAVLASQQGYGFGDPFALFMVMLAFTLSIAALTLLMGTLVRSEQQAGGLTTLLALTLAPLGGAWWSLDLEFIPEFMRTISYLSPLRYVMDGFNTVIFDNGTVLDVLPQVGVLLAIAAVLFVFGARRFNAMRG